MRKSFIIILVVLLLVAGGFLVFISQRNGTSVPNISKMQPTTLEIIEILSNVNPPFPNTDTLCLETGMKLCGNAPNGFELPISPGKLDIPFIEKLKAWANLTHPNREDLKKIMDTTVIYSVYHNKSDGNNLNRSKIYVLVTLKQSKENSHFVVYENYLYRDTFRVVAKRFKIEQSLHTATKLRWLSLL
jgi:hypothetical protein